MHVIVKELWGFGVTEYWNVSNIAYSAGTYTITYENAGTPTTATVDGSANYVFVLANDPNA